MAKSADPCRDPCLPRCGDFDTQHVPALILSTVSRLESEYLVISYPPAINQGATVIVHAMEGAWRHPEYGRRGIVGARIPCRTGGFDYLLVFPEDGSSAWVHGSCVAKYAKRMQEISPPKPLVRRVTVANSLRASMARLPPKKAIGKGRGLSVVVSE